MVHCRRTSMAASLWLRHGSFHFQYGTFHRSIRIGLGSGIPCSIRACRNRRQRRSSRSPIRRLAFIWRHTGSCVSKSHYHDIRRPRFRRSWRTSADVKQKITPSSCPSKSGNAVQLHPKGHQTNDLCSYQ